MTIDLELLPGLPVTVADRSAHIGGSFFYEPLRVYDPYPLEWVYGKLKDTHDAVMLDIGASAGCFTLLAKHIPTLRVAAFEPVNLVWNILAENAHLNSIDNRVTCFDFAVADYNGEGTFLQVVEEGGLGCSQLGGKPFDGKNVYEVPVNVITVDEFCRKFRPVVDPALIKIDTEGGELAVLKGAKQTIERCHPLICAEYEPLCTAQYGYHPDEIVNLLYLHGYTVKVEGTNLFAEWGI